MALSKEQHSPDYKKVWFGPYFLAALKGHKLCTMLDLLKYCFSPNEYDDINRLSVMSRIKLLLPDDNSDAHALAVFSALTSESLMPPGLPVTVKWLPHEGAPDSLAVPWPCTLGAASYTCETGSRFVKSADGRFAEHVLVHLNLDDVTVDTSLPCFAAEHSVPVVRFMDGLYVGALNASFLPEGHGRLIANGKVQVGVWKNGLFVDGTT